MTDYTINDVKIELIHLRNFLHNEPFEYEGFAANLRKTAVLVDRIVSRIKESIETGGIQDEVNLNAYMMSDTKSVERGL